ncbi:MAG: deoxynucleoside kinase [Balneolales bacterium]|nr:deoxynucleoside kinase [Balneolales bacterium]
MNTFDYIAIEGVIGAGKTSLAEMLSKKHRARLVLEEFEENPFLPKFYEDRERYAFQTQLAFLSSRFNQQQRLLAKDLFDNLIVSDYIFDKDRIFARLNLSDDELALYDKIYQIMSGIAARPDLMVFIQCSVERLLENIKKRGRTYEQQISPDYLNELNESYNHFFKHYNKSPVLIIRANDIDFVNNKSHFDFIEHHIFNEPIKQERVYIKP